ncbi:ribonuclease III [bacterium]|nr:ribonuclease III [bacterium]|tara:strand:+ start:2941 stop:3630 length:690 start_codon:yes stop_codon:yes gene_type:complete
MINLKSLQSKLNYQFEDTSILETALTHKSFANENQNIQSNERLEFLGDAVLELVVTKFLFEKFPDRQEGYLTSLRSALVRGKNIAKVLETLEVLEYIKLSFGEQRSNGSQKSYIQANVYEAIVGAIYMDGGYEKASKFIFETVIPTLDGIIEEQAHIDSKSHLQEIAQERFNLTPTYHLQKESGPDHNKQFEMGVFFFDKLIATGKGSSKQKAEIEAAYNALQEIQKES